MGADTTTARSESEPLAHGFDRYDLLERLDAGGMGEIYSAWDQQLERKVAMKLLATSQVNYRFSNMP